MVKKFNHWKTILILAAITIICHWLISETTVGKANKKIVEAYAPYLWGNLCLFIANIMILFKSNQTNGDTASYSSNA